MAGKVLCRGKTPSSLTEIVPIHSGDEQEVRWASRVKPHGDLLTRLDLQSRAVRQDGGGAAAQASSAAVPRRCGLPRSSEEATSAWYPWHSTKVLLLAQRLTEASEGMAIWAAYTVYTTSA